jgi:hypothetical protein
MTIPEIIRSSASPEKISMFVKSLAVFAVLFGFDKAVVDEAESQIANLVVLVAQVVTVLTALYGLLRKVKFGRWAASK